MTQLLGSFIVLLFVGNILFRADSTSFIADQVFLATLLILIGIFLLFLQQEKGIKYFSLLIIALFCANLGTHIFWILPLGFDTVNPITSLVDGGTFDPPGYESDAMALLQQDLNYDDVPQKISYYIAAIYSLTEKNVVNVAYLNILLIFLGTFYLLNKFKIQSNIHFYSLAGVLFFPEIFFYSLFPGKEAISFFSIALIIGGLHGIVTSPNKWDALAVVSGTVVILPIRFVIPIFAYMAYFISYLLVIRKLKWITVCLIYIISSVVITGIFYDELKGLWEFAVYLDNVLSNSGDTLKQFVRELISSEVTFYLWPIFVPIKFVLYAILNYPLLPRGLDLSYLVSNYDIWIFGHQMGVYFTGLTIVSYVLTKCSKGFFLPEANKLLMLTGMFMLTFLANATFFLHLRYRFAALPIICISIIWDCSSNNLFPLLIKNMMRCLIISIIFSALLMLIF